MDALRSITRNEVRGSRMSRGSRFSKWVRNGSCRRVRRRGGLGDVDCAEMGKEDIARLPGFLGERVPRPVGHHPDELHLRLQGLHHRAAGQAMTDVAGHERRRQRPFSGLGPLKLGGVPQLEGRLVAESPPRAARRHGGVIEHRAPVADPLLDRFPESGGVVLQRMLVQPIIEHALADDDVLHHGDERFTTGRNGGDFLRRLVHEGIRLLRRGVEAEEGEG